MTTEPKTEPKPKRTGNYKAGPGRKPLPPGQKKQFEQVTLRVSPALHAYLKTLPPGSMVKILEQHRADSLIVD